MGELLPQRAHDAVPGGFVPLWLYPRPLAAVASVLPFMFVTYEPLSIYLGRLKLHESAVVLAMQRWLEQRPGPVVVSVATGRTVDDVAARAGCALHRSRVGEENVLETMTEHGAEVGGEGDGGLIVLPVNSCRDSFVAMALILEAMAVSGSPVSALRARAPRYAMIAERLLCQARDIAPSLRLVKIDYR